MATFIPIPPFPTPGFPTVANNLPTFSGTALGTVLPVPLGKGYNGGRGVYQTTKPIDPLPGILPSPGSFAM